MLYELRHQDARSVRHLDQLNQYYSDQILPLWNRLGIEPIGFWTAIIGTAMPRLTCLLAWEDLGQRQARWGAYLAEESQQEARSLVQTTSNSILQATAFSPQPRRDPPANLLGGVYELRTYAFHSEAHLQEASEWFRETGLPQSDKHGMVVMGIWTTSIGIAPRLTTMLVFENLAHRERVWASFYTDPAWPKLQDRLYPQGEPLIAATENCIMKGTEFSVWR